jgi:hypothetical protein
MKYLDQGRSYSSAELRGKPLFQMLIIIWNYGSHMIWRVRFASGLVLMKR